MEKTAHGLANPVARLEGRQQVSFTVREMFLLLLGSSKNKQNCQATDQQTDDACYIRGKNISQRRRMSNNQYEEVCVCANQQKGAAF